MEAIDRKIQLELKNLPEELKKQVLFFISNLKRKKNATEVNEPQTRYGACKDMFGHVPDNLDEMSASEDFKDYI